MRARYSRIKAGDLGAAKAHLRYILRDGTTRDGRPGTPYDRERDHAEIDPFLTRSAGDPHQFRFTIAPEDSARLSDLKPFIRDLMAQAEQDLGTRLDWVAVDHFNTGHPHTHIVIRGKDDRGNDLIIDRSYIGYGLRARAQGLMTLELGPESKLERLQKLSNEVAQERFTRLDRSLLGCAKDNVITLSALRERGASRQTMLAGRLHTLARLGIAEERQSGVWLLKADIETKLCALADRADKIKMMQRGLKQAGLERGASSYAVFERGGRAKALVGKVIGSGFINEITDRCYPVVDGVDGRVHYVEIGQTTNTEMLEHGMIIGLGERGTRSKPTSNPDLRILSLVSLERLPDYEGPTWLDEMLIARAGMPSVGHSGFGADVKSAVEKRVEWLMLRGLVERRPDGRIMAKATLPTELYRLEIGQLGQDLYRETGRPFQHPEQNKTVTGIYERSIATPTQKLAVFRTKTGVALAPWRQSLEQSLGQSVTMRLSQGPFVGGPTRDCRLRKK